MILGILSDSHGRIETLRAALRLLSLSGARRFIHCGDVGGLDALEELAGYPISFVWGNTDDPSDDWRGDIERIGLQWPEGPLDLVIEGRRIGVFHGHEREFDRAVELGEYDYIFHGHTHQKADRRVGRTRMINPGTLHRAATKTVAMLDLDRDELRFLVVSPAQ